MKSVIITLIVQSTPLKHQSFIWNALLCSTFHFQISSPIKGLVTCIFQFESVIYITYGKILKYKQLNLTTKPLILHLSTCLPLFTASRMTIHDYHSDFGTSGSCVPDT